MNNKTKDIIRGISLVCFIFYLIFMVYVLFFAESMGRTSVGRGYSYNLNLFQEICRFWQYRQELGMGIVAVNLLGNVVCFIPFGLILPILFRSGRNFFVTFLLSAGFSFVVEVIQLVTRTGSFDVDDLLLNTIGGVTGFLLFTICNYLRRKQYG